MNKSELEDKLTPAAEETLKGIVQDYRNKILLTSAASASISLGEVREISVSDIIRSVRSTSRPAWSESRDLLETILKFYVGVGFILVGVSIGFLSTDGLLDVTDKSQQLIQLLGLSGVSIGGISYLFLQFRFMRKILAYKYFSNYRKDDTELVAVYISKWQQIEAALRNYVSVHFGESLAESPVSILAARLLHEKTLSEADATQLKKLLQTRNRLVHKGIDMDHKELEESVRQADRILGKLIGGLIVKYQ